MGIEDIKVKRSTIILITLTVLLGLGSLFGITYAYFYANVNNPVGSSVGIEIANLGNVIFTDGNEINTSNMYPGDTYTKNFTIVRSGATAGTSIYYKIMLNVRSNTLSPVANNAFLQTLSGTASGYGTVARVSNSIVPITTSQIGSTAQIIGNETHTYVYTIKLLETGLNQNSTRNKGFSGYLQVESVTGETGIVDTGIFQRNRGNLSDYTLNNIKVHYDAYKNTITGYNSTITSWHDISGNQNSGTLTNFAMNSTSGWLNGSPNYGGLKFDGVNDVVTITNSNNFLCESGKAFSVGVTFKTGSTIDTHKGLVSNMILEDGIYEGFNLAYHPTGGVLVRKPDGQYFKTNEPLSINTQYTVYLTYDGTNMKIYVNGVLKVQENISLINSGALMRIGTFYSTGSLRFDGILYDFHFYDRALTEEEITQNYLNINKRINLQTITGFTFPVEVYYDAKRNVLEGYNSTTTIWKDLNNNLNGTLSNFAMNTTSGWNNNGLKFDGVDDFVTVSGADYSSYGSGSIFSIVTTFKTSPTLGVLQGVVSLLYSDLTGGFNIGYNSNGGLLIRVSGGSPASTSYLSTSAMPILLANTTYTVALTYDGSVMKAYVNGELIRSETRSIAAPSPTLTLGRFYSNHTNYPFSGTLYNFAFQKEVLSASEVQRIYNESYNRYYN